MAVNASETVTRPRWPDELLDPTRAWLDFDAEVDEILLYFGGKPVPSFDDAIDAPEGDDAALLIRLGPNDEDTGEVVGIHVYPFLVGPVNSRPHWRALAEPNPPPDAVARFVAEVKELFERYWTPAPPIEEQMARRARRDDNAGAV